MGIDKKEVIANQPERPRKARSSTNKKPGWIWVVSENMADKNMHQAFALDSGTRKARRH